MVTTRRTRVLGPWRFPVGHTWPKDKSLAPSARETAIYRRICTSRSDKAPRPSTRLIGYANNNVLSFELFLMPIDKLGAHVSSAGGVQMAPARAKAIGATAMQIFTKQANQWKERVCEADECSAFKGAMAETEVVESCAHDSYLINLASPKPDLRAKSLESFVQELQRCDALGADLSRLTSGELHG